MGKAKKNVNGKGSFSDHVRSRHMAKKSGAAQSVRTNPFEIKINKQKHKIIGKNLTKFDKGVPGVSRSRAIKKRQETLLVEFKNKKKSNRLIDHRIGENDPSSTLEEKMMGRFAAEGKKRHGRGSIFNIDDDEDGVFDQLTHKGHSLLEIEKFDKPLESDEEEEGNEAGNLKGDIVTEGHFGGGMLQKKAGSEAEQEKSWKDRMEEMIAKSKLAKHERQTEKDEVVQMTDKLDDQWRVLHNVVAARKVKEAEHIEADDFDIAVNELKYESRGNPTDRLKTEAEAAKIEKDKLEKLERARLARMRGETKGRSHASADDLDDGMDYGSFGEEEEFEVKYKDGKLISSGRNEEDTDDSDDSEEDEESESDEEEEASGASGDDESDSEEDDGSEEEDEYSDLESEDGDVSDGVEEDESVEVNAPQTKKKKTKSDVSKSSSQPYAHIPFTFTIPETFSALVELLDKYELDEQNVVIERMRKCNHASLAEGNNLHLVRLYGFLLEYFGDLALRNPVPIVMLDRLTVHLYDIAKQFPQLTCKHSKHIITERQKLFSLYCQSKGGRGVWPFLDLLMYFKVLSCIYPTSDFRHEVTTPAMLFASQIYSSCAVTNHRDVAVGLMLTTVMAEYVSFSKAVMPECINFLSALLYTASSTTSKTSKVNVATTTCRASLLKCKACGNDLRSKDIKPFNLNQVIARGVGNSIYNTDGFILTALQTAAVLLKKFISFYTDTPAAVALFSHAKSAVDQINTEDYPQSLKAQFDDLKESLGNVGPTNLGFVCREKKKPKVLRLYEPDIEDDFEAGKKKVPKDKVAAEKQKLKQQYKKELKSTIREVKKDRAFIAEQKIKESIKRDAERQKKTNLILADLQGQQHVVNMHKKMTNPTQRQRSHKH